MYKDLILQENPIVYYRLDDVSGNNNSVFDTQFVQDGIQVGSGLTTGKGAVLETSTVYNGAFFFKNLSSYVAIDYNSHFNPISSQAFSLEFWVKIDETPVLSIPVISSNDGINGWEVSITSDLKISFLFSGGTGFQADIILQSWNHVVITNNGSLWKIYVNGEFISSSVLIVTTNSTSRLFLGTNYNSSSFFTGALDEIAIYNIELSSTNVANHFGSVEEINSEIDPEESWLETTISSLNKYISEKTSLYDVRTSFPEESKEQTFFPLGKKIIHFEIDDIQNRIIGFGDGTDLYTPDYDDNIYTIMPKEAGWHELNVDVGVWASANTGGSTSRLRAYQFLINNFYGARAYASLQTMGIQLIYFRGGMFTRETIQEQDIYRVAGIELGLRVFSIKTTSPDEAGPYITDIFQDENLTL